MGIVVGVKEKYGTMATKEDIHIFNLMFFYCKQKDVQIGARYPLEKIGTK